MSPFRQLPVTDSIKGLPHTAKLTGSVSQQSQRPEYHVHFYAACRLCRLLLGSPDNSNLVYLYDGSTQIGAYVGGPSAEGDGSPIGIQAGYVDFSASAGEEITSIELLNAGSFWFETDNLSYQEAPVSSTPTPSPALSCSWAAAW